MKYFRLLTIRNYFPYNASVVLAVLSITQAILGGSQNAEASGKDGLVMTAQMQISYTARNTSLESHNVDVRLQSCDENKLQLTPFKDGANELADFPNVAASGCIELDKSSIPFDRIKLGANRATPGTSIETEYDLTGIDAYFDTTHREPVIDLTGCLTPPSQVLFNKINPRESYAHCAPDNDLQITPGLTINSQANLYLLLFRYSARDNAAGLPDVTVIVGLVE